MWRRDVAETLVGTLAAGQVNSNNIGIPLSLYLLGSAAYPAPVILLQLLVFTPITMAIFEAVTTGQRRPFPTASACSDRRGAAATSSSLLRSSSS